MRTGIFHRRRFGSGLALYKRLGAVSVDRDGVMIYGHRSGKTSVSGYGHLQCGGQEDKIASEIKSGIIQIRKMPQ